MTRPALAAVVAALAVAGCGSPCDVAALPMKIAGGSGGPLRIVARLPDAAGP